MRKLKIIFICFTMLFLAINSYCQNSDTLVQKALEYFENKQYEESALEFEKALPIIEQEYGTLDTVYYTKQLVYTAQSHENIQQYEEAEKYYLHVKSIYETLDATKDPLYATNLWILANLYREMGKYDAALPLYEEAISIRLEILGDNHPDYASSLNDLAMLFYKMGNYDDALPLYEEAKAIRKEALGAKHTDYAASLSDLALLFSDIGNFEAAIPLFEEAIAIYNELEVIDIYYATILNNFAMLYHKMGNYDEALLVFQDAILISKEAPGENQIAYAVFLLNMSSLHHDMGNYEASLMLSKEASTKLKETLGSQHQSYAVSLNNLSNLQKDMGNYEPAIRSMKEASMIFKEALGAKSFMYAVSLNNLAMLYVSTGNYDVALGLYLDCKEILTEVLGDKHPNYARCLNNMAKLYSREGNYEAALPLLEEASKIYKEKLGVKHPSYATCLNNLAGIHTALGNYAIALPLYQEAILIYNDALGAKHTKYAKSLNSMANLYYKTGEYSTALPLFMEAKEIRLEVLGADHQDYASSLTDLAGLYVAMGNYTDAIPLYDEANMILNNNFQDNFSYLSENEKEKYLFIVRSNYDVYLSFLYRINLIYPEFSRNGYDNELMLKGLILNSVTSLQQSILTSNDTSLIQQFENLRMLKRQITLQLQEPIAKRREDLSILEQQAYDIELELSQHSRNYINIQALFQTKWQNIRKNLKNDEAAIEFISFNYFNKKYTDSTFYCALILKKNDTIPQFIYLCEEPVIQGAMPSSGATYRKINYVYQEPELYQLIWQPIDSLLDGIETIYYAPSGLLNSVSMAAIPCPDNELLMEKYNLVQLSSTRTLAMPAEDVTINNVVVYGGINYDTDSLTLRNNAEKYKKEEDEFIAYNRSYTEEYGGGFRYLPGSLEELESISSKLEKKDITVTTYSGTQALEESFLALSGNDAPSVIHLSTHGFYFPDTVSKENRKNIMNSSTGEVRFRYHDDPLLRSGLLMAGANLAWKGQAIPDHVEDGILTAKEVSNMNLMNTELVVLSACQSGLGDVKGSEGVEGLQRGFNMAGVRYIIMSLWQVPDKETTEFMDKFYHHWLSGEEIHEAFHHTQKHMRHKYKNDPFKWAGFVLME